MTSSDGRPVDQRGAAACEGEGWSATLYSWRLRRPTGPSFALAGRGTRRARLAIVDAVIPGHAPTASNDRRADEHARLPAGLSATTRPLPRAVVSHDLLGPRGANAAPVYLPAPPAPPGGGELPLLRVFGPLRVERPEPAAPGLRSARGLIAYLALHRCPAPLDELLEVLWPSQNPARTRPRLWKAKRRACDILGDALGRRGLSYALDHARLRLDVLEVERLSRPSAGLAQLEWAASLSAGVPLADVDYPFADSHRRRLQSLRSDVLMRLARARLESGRAGAALGAAEELIAADRFNEQGWRLAMEAEAALGARQAIIDRYRLLRSQLDAELGLAPQAETRLTYLRLLGQG